MPSSLLLGRVRLKGNRSKVDQNTNQHLLKIQGVNDRQSLTYYQGKRCCYIFKAPTEVHGTKYRVNSTRMGFMSWEKQKKTLFFGKWCLGWILRELIQEKQTIWGRIGAPHGTNGVCKARFAPHLPPKSMGATIRVMLYPNRANIAGTFKSL